MPENIINKIGKAETDAKKFIEDARKKAITLKTHAKKEMEESVTGFGKKCSENLKKYKEEKAGFYKSEAKKIEGEGRLSGEEFTKSIESKLPEIKKKVKESIRKELCL